MQMRRLTLALVAAVALAACGGDEPLDSGNDTGDTAADTASDADEPGVDPVDLIDGEWMVDQLTVDGERIELDASWPVTVMVDADTVSGTAGCNHYTGVLDVSTGAGHGRFVVSDLSWTEMGCEPPAMEIEQAFLSALQAVDSYELADGVYVAEAGGGTNFHLARDQAAAPGTTGQEAPTPPAEPSTALEGLDGAGGLDGPVMYAARTDGEQGQMAAEIIGTLELDGDCLYTSFEGNRYPVLWPFGTTWDEDSSSVVLPDGTALPLGGELYGGGGYLYPDTIGGLISSDGVLERAEQCAEEPYFEIAVLQST